MAITHAQPTGGGGRSSLENVPARPKSGKNTARKSTGGKAPRKNRMFFLFLLSCISSEGLLERLLRMRITVDYRGGISWRGNSGSCQVDTSTDEQPYLADRMNHHRQQLRNVNHTAIDLEQ
jgi:hypothetical protein